MEKRKRSIVKALVYRLILIITNGLVVFIATKRIDLTIGVSISTAILNTVIYYLYERVWNSIRWAKK